MLIYFFFFDSFFAENAEVENGLAKLLIELLSRAGIDHSNNLYQGMPSSEQYEGKNTSLSIYSNLKMRQSICHSHLCYMNVETV